MFDTWKDRIGLVIVSAGLLVVGPSAAAPPGKSTSGDGKPLTATTGSEDTLLASNCLPS